MRRLGPGSIKPPDYGCGEEDATEEVAGELVVAGGDAAEFLEPVEHAFDEVALPVDLSVVRSERLAPGNGGE